MANRNSETPKIAALGPSHTFTDFAADLFNRKKFKETAVKKLYPSIAEVFDALKKQKVDYAVVPINNTTYGTVRASFDALFQSDLSIVYKFSIPIHHCLAVKKDTQVSNIKQVISHHQAIEQCSHYLKRKYPNAQLISFSSTAEAIQDCLSGAKGNKAVICSKSAASKYSLKIIQNCIEDRKDNKTYFAVLQKKDEQKLDFVRLTNMQTSIAFYFHKDKPGSLFSVLKDFADLDVNMTKIESRPAPKEMGDYIFFLDFEGNLDDLNVKKLIKSISQKVAGFKEFGSYPVDDLD